MNHFYPITIISIRYYKTEFNWGFPYVSRKLMGVNDYDKIRDRVCECFAKKGRWPNFIAVDFVGVSDNQELKIVADINLSFN